MRKLHFYPACVLFACTLPFGSFFSQSFFEYVSFALFSTPDAPGLTISKSLVWSAEGTSESLSRCNLAIVPG